MNRWLFLLLAIAPLNSLAAELKPAELRPNIVLVMADDQGWGDVGFRGHPILKTPVMDELAATGIRFDRFYASAPVCSPTRGSVMTGRHPNRFGCFSWGHTLRPQEWTVAELLKQGGYTTGHFGKWHLGGVAADDPNCPGNSGFDRWVSSPNFYENSPLMSDQGKVIETSGESSLVTVAAATEFIRDAVQREQPFLAVVWFGSPHAPHQALPADREPYAELADKLQNFYGEITAMDRAVGQLRRELRSLNVAENTLFWYCSDNGALPVGSAGGLRGKKSELWEGGIRVPAMIEWPGRFEGHQVIQVPCTTCDILPTVLAAAGIDPPDDRPLDGRNLLPLLSGETWQADRGLGFWVHPTAGISTPSQKILAELRERQRGAGDPPREATPAVETRVYPEDRFPGKAAWVEGNWKLHRIPQGQDGEVLQLYDLNTDPAEQTDVASQHPQRVQQMLAALKTWQHSVAHSLNGRDYPEQ